MSILSTRRQVILYTIVSYSLAIALDVTAYLYTDLLRNPITSFAWSFTRMWSPTVATILCLYVARENIRTSLKGIINFNIKALKWYLISPFIVYLALGIYLAVAIPLNLFNFGIYIDMIRKALVSQGFNEELAQQLATIQAYVNITFNWYLAAITINTLFALGEEIGWRGYLYNLLKDMPLPISTLIIGLIWGYWHTSITLLLGHNYQVNRILGGFLLFPILTTITTYIYLEIVRRSKSVIPAASLHGAFNALWGLTLVSNLPQEAKELYLGLGVLGITVWMAICIAVYYGLRTTGVAGKQA